MIQIIDTLSHPTISGKWLDRDLNCSFESLSNQLKSSNFKKALAVGISGKDDYSHEEFIQNCRKFSNLVPIAGFNPNKSLQSIKNELKKIKELGFVGIKIHPRFNEVEYDCDLLSSVFNLANDFNLVTMYCTYSHCASPKYPINDPFYKLAEALNKSIESKIILVHGGDVSLLKYAELARFNENILLDLSLTMMKYSGSSIDQDIQFLFNRFDRKITIGTDFPEYSHSEVYEKFLLLSSGVPKDKLENIAFKNIESFFKKIKVEL